MVFLSAVGMAIAGPAGAEERRTPEEKKPWYELSMMSDPILDQVLLFYLGESWQGLSDIGECLETAGRVTASDPTSWSREWRITAERLRATAAASEKAGHLRSAGQAWLRAATYYRASLHRHQDPSAPEVREMAQLEVSCFTKAISLLKMPVETVKIPYRGTTLPGYLFRVSTSGRPAPLVIVHQGRDAWAEDCTYLAREANARGYHCLLVDGPGMGKTIRLQGLPFRPDWERVITPIVDWAVKVPGVDAKRIALMGLSMGGALAPRAAAFEKRLKLCIANPGVLSWADIVSGFLSGGDPGMAELPFKDPAAFDAHIAKMSAENPLISWGIRDTMWRHGQSSPSALMRELLRYTNKGFAEKITCKVLVIDGEGEDFGQSRALYDALRCPKDYLLFTNAETAGQHVQVGAIAIASQRIFDWIDDNI